MLIVQMQLPEHVLSDKVLSNLNYRYLYHLTHLGVPGAEDALAAIVPTLNRDQLYDLWTRHHLPIIGDRLRGKVTPSFVLQHDDPSLLQFITPTPELLIAALDTDKNRLVASLSEQYGLDFLLDSDYPCVAYRLVMEGSPRLITDLKNQPDRLEQLIPCLYKQGQLLDRVIQLTDRIGFFTLSAMELLARLSLSQYFYRLWREGRGEEYIYNPVYGRRLQTLYRISDYFRRNNIVVRG